MPATEIFQFYRQERNTRLETNLALISSLRLQFQQDFKVFHTTTPVVWPFQILGGPLSTNHCATTRSVSRLPIQLSITLHSFLQVCRTNKTCVSVWRIEDDRPFYGYVPPSEEIEGNRRQAEAFSRREFRGRPFSTMSLLKSISPSLSLSLSLSLSHSVPRCTFVGTRARIYIGSSPTRGVVRGVRRPRIKTRARYISGGAGIVAPRRDAINPTLGESSAICNVNGDVLPLIRIFGERDSFGRWRGGYVEIERISRGSL